jgi:hypothetical protein
LLADVEQVDSDCRVCDIDQSLLKQWNMKNITIFCEQIDPNTEASDDLVPYPDVTSQSYDPTDYSMRQKFGPRWSKWLKHGLIAAALKAMDHKAQPGIYNSLTIVPALTGTAQDRTNDLWPQLREEFKKLDQAMNLELRKGKQDLLKFQSK